MTSRMLIFDERVNFKLVSKRVHRSIKAMSLEVGKISYVVGQSEIIWDLSNSIADFQT